MSDRMDIIRGLIWQAASQLLVILVALLAQVADAVIPCQDCPSGMFCVDFLGICEPCDRCTEDMGYGCREICDEFKPLTASQEFPSVPSTQTVQTPMLTSHPRMPTDISPPIGSEATRAYGGSSDVKELPFGLVFGLFVALVITVSLVWLLCKKWRSFCKCVRNAMAAVRQEQPAPEDIEMGDRGRRTDQDDPSGARVPGQAQPRGRRVPQGAYAPLPVSGGEPEELDRCDGRNFSSLKSDEARARQSSSGDSGIGESIRPRGFGYGRQPSSDLEGSAPGLLRPYDTLQSEGRAMEGRYQSAQVVCGERQREQYQMARCASLPSGARPRTPDTHRRITDGTQNAEVTTGKGEFTPYPLCERKA